MVSKNLDLHILFRLGRFRGRIFHGGFRLGRFRGRILHGGPSELATHHPPSAQAWQRPSVRQHSTHPPSAHQRLGESPTSDHPSESEPAASRTSAQALPCVSGSAQQINSVSTPSNSAASSILDGTVTPICNRIWVASNSMNR